MYDKTKFLIENNLALYSVHLPMDAHSVYSHSKVFSDFLGLKILLLLQIMAELI